MIGPVARRALRKRFLVQPVRRRMRRSALARQLRSTALTSIDVVERSLRRRNGLAPPRRLRGVGAGDFRSVGDALLKQMVDVGGLRRDARVVDIGCGSGRVVIPLMGYLREGSYEGFDIAPEMIDWCRENITARVPRFGFSLIDVSNTHYNPDGALAADAVRFPYPDGEFDFALATSLFTHLLPAGFVNYAQETARVLAPGGTLFGTFCLIDDESLPRVRRGEARIDLRHRMRDPANGIAYRAVDSRSPETAVGLDAPFVMQSLADAGLTVTAVHPGLWSGRSSGLSYQDVVIARRR